MHATKLDIKNHLLSKVRALGNTKKGLKEVCSDLVNQFGTDTKSFERIAKGTFLSVNTIRRISTLKDCDTGEVYKPQSETIERILIYFGAEIHFEQVPIRNEFRN